MATPGVTRVGNPCGDGAAHFLCRQLGFCMWGQLPVGFNGENVDKLNAKLMAVAFWGFIATAIPAAALYKHEYYTTPLEMSIKHMNQVFSVVLIVVGVPCLFPTYFSISLCDIFKAKIIANQTWNIINVWAGILFYSLSFEGYAMVMFSMGWSVAMFTVTARGSWRRLPDLWSALPDVGELPLAYGGAIAWIGVTFLIGALRNMGNDSRTAGFFICFAAANWFLGYVCWASMEGYAHVHQWTIYPDSRLWQWKGPQTLEVPPSKELPGSWDGKQSATSSPGSPTLKATPV